MRWNDRAQSSLLENVIRSVLEIGTTVTIGRAPPHRLLRSSAPPRETGLDAGLKLTGRYVAAELAPGRALDLGCNRDC